MKRLLFLSLLPLFSFSQGYTSYFTGNTTNITTIPTFGVTMMGGGTDNDNAMTWLLQKANGGDVVVLRCSGSNEYNNYLYSQLGVNVNSVETLVITSATGATNPYVLDKVSNAEMIWLADGNQWDYISYFKDNALEDLINYHINTKHAPIGGTGAGMSILGHEYFTAQNGNVTSTEALNNPYHPNVTVAGFAPVPPFYSFLNMPGLHTVITDSHYDNPDNRGRHIAFMARILKDMISPGTCGIACNERTAICFGSDLIGHVYGNYPSSQDLAYFIQPSCFWGTPGPYCIPGQPLTWGGLMAYVVPGTPNGDNYFKVDDWGNFYSVNYSGGSWEDWLVSAGVVSTTPGTGPSGSCALSVGENEPNKFNVLPNPFSNYITLENAQNAMVEIFDSLGKKVFISENFTSNSIDTSQFSSGLYFVKIQKEGNTVTKKIVKN